jgi:hypothetical protein
LLARVSHQIRIKLSRRRTASVWLVVDTQAIEHARKRISDRTLAEADKSIQKARGDIREGRQAAGQSHDAMVTTAAVHAYKAALADGLAGVRGCWRRHLHVHALATAANHAHDKLAEACESPPNALAGGKYSGVHGKHALYMGDCTKPLLDARDAAVSDLRHARQDTDAALMWRARHARPSWDRECGDRCGRDRNCRVVFVASLTAKPDT